MELATKIGKEELNMKKKKKFLSAVLGLLVMVSFLTIAYAASYTAIRLPTAGGHTDLTGYVKRTTSDGTIYNSCTKSATLSGTVYAFHTWIDQESVGQVTDTLQIQKGQGKNYSMRAYPAVDTNCKGRASTIGLLSAAMYVTGSISFK